MPKKPLQKLEFPIFSIATFKNYTIVSGGGGGKKYGLKNKLIVLKRENNDTTFNIKDKTIDMDLPEEDIIENLHVTHKHQLMLGNSESNCVVYYLELDSQQKLVNIKELTRFQTDYAKEDPCQNDGKISDNLKYIGTGGEDSIARVFTVTYDKQTQSIKQEKYHDFAYHTGPINAVDFNKDENLFVTASVDKTCRIFNLEKKIQVKKLNCVEKSSLENFKFISAYFSLAGDQLYTIQNPDRGASYLTIWNLSDNEVQHQKDLKVHHNPITASSLSRDGNYLGVGSGDGTAKIIDLQQFCIRNKNLVHDMVVKGLDFTTDGKFLISGTPEFGIDLLPNTKQTGLFTYVVLFTFIAIIISRLIEITF